MKSLFVVETPNAINAHLGMLAWAVIVGLSFPAVHLLSSDLPPVLLTAMRFAVAALAIWPLVRRKTDRWPRLSGLVLYTAMGLCLGGFFAIMFWAAHRVTALSMATLYVTVPIMTYCIGRSLGVERPATGLLAALILGAIGALGLAWAQADGRLGGLRFGINEGVYFTGCVVSAIYPVLSKWGLNKGLLSPLALVRSFWSFLTGGLLIGLAGLIWEGPQALAALTLTDALVVIYLGAISTAVTAWLLQRAIAALTPGAATAYKYLTPFVAMILLLIREPEHIGWRWLPGCLLVVCTVVILLRREDMNRRSHAAAKSVHTHSRGRATAPCHRLRRPLHDAAHRISNKGG